jgi:hypothetical protein
VRGYFWGGGVVDFLGGSFKKEGRKGNLRRKEKKKEIRKRKEKKKKFPGWVS